MGRAIQRLPASTVSGGGRAPLSVSPVAGAPTFGGFVILAILLANLMACSLGAEGETQRPGKDPGQATAHREAPAASERSPAAEGETTASAPVSWDYVGLGDSLAAGVGARKGYVERYADHAATDTGARVEVTNLGRSGQTSPQLLAVLRDDEAVRRELRAAEIITFNIGINDLGRAGEAYENGTCGGKDNEDCLRSAVERVKRNWEAVVAEILGLRSTEDAIIRTAGLGYTPRVDEVYEPYLREVNRHIAETAAENEIPYAQPYLDDGYMSPDGIHPNDDGYGVIAERLRALGYVPLER